jgi:hypothetical protein
LAGKILASTIQENAPMMKELLDVNPSVFFPSIPHLVSDSETSGQQTPKTQTPLKEQNVHPGA